MTQKPTSDDPERHAAALARLLRKRLEQAIGRWLKYRHKKGLQSDTSWIVAFSGGPDSTALLNLLHKAFPEKKIVLAHMNHHARPGADEDEQFARKTSSELGLPLEVGHWHAHRASHFESDARTARHAWLAALALQYHASAVFTAHTMDDQAETVLMRMARGTGPTGLAGIRPWRPLAKTTTDLVRPLLGTTKQELLDYLQSQSFTYCTDPTNLDTQHQSRAWVRHVLLPLIQSRLNPNIHMALAQLSDLVAEEQDGLATWVATKTRRCAHMEHDRQRCLLNLAGFRRSGPPWVRRLLLRQVWARMGWPLREMSMKHWVAISRWITSPETMPNSTRCCPGGIKLIRLAESVLLQRNQAPTQETILHDVREVSPLPLAWPGTTCLGSICVDAMQLDHCPPMEQVRSADSSQVAYLDQDTISLPLLLRHPEEGDRFDPLGLGGHHQRVVDFLRIQGIASHNKQSTWLLCDQQGIIWVVGHRVSHRVRITSKTVRTAQLTIIPQEGLDA